MHPQPQTQSSSNAEQQTEELIWVHTQRHHALILAQSSLSLPPGNEYVNEVRQIWFSVVVVARAMDFGKLYGKVKRPASFKKLQAICASIC